MIIVIVHSISYMTIVMNCVKVDVGVDRMQLNITMVLQTQEVMIQKMMNYIKDQDKSLSAARFDV